MQHVATWKEGDEKWAYHKDAFAHIGTHKVSLDPYRLESRRILGCIKDVLPAPPLQRVEKASVDEVFLDLSAQIHSILLERHPELRGPPPYDDPTECLPRPPTTALDWTTDALVDLDDTESEEDDPDWDDIAMSIGSEIIRTVRSAIRERLKYTCSAGIARNKMVAKLGSAHRKPNQQTIVRNRAVQQFMSGYKFTKIRNLGGKLGDEVVSQFTTDQVSELLKVSMEQLKLKLGDDTGSWVHRIIRGEDSSEVSPRTQIKSMLSAKSFRPTINTSEQGVRWLRIFAADIMSRLIEEGVLENKRRPKTISLHHRQGGEMRSKQVAIPTGRPIDETLLFDLAQTLLGQVVVDGRAWPCSNLRLSVGAFEDGPTGNRGIGGFLVRGEAAKVLTKTTSDEGHSDSVQPAKRRKVDDGGIQNFFVKRDHSHEDSAEFSDPTEYPGPGLRSSSPNVTGNPAYEEDDATAPNDMADQVNEKQGDQGPSSPAGIHQATITSYFCERCKRSIQAETRDEHEDWHFAKNLQAQVQGSDVPEPTAAPGTTAHTFGPKRPSRPKTNVAPVQKSIEKGQKKLAFG